jgi:quinohemoprotein amine dehydrogenase
MSLSRRRLIFAIAIRLGGIGFALLTSSVTFADSPGDSSAGTLLQTRCGGCHQSSQPGTYARISSLRKTPEGWLMTIFRMQQAHGLQISETDRDALVRFLADTQGLAPSEALPARYALERRPNMQDLQLPGELQTLCARCHSAARIALQRRGGEEWEKLVHFHVGQWPTLEYQDKARDRTWWQIASTEVPSQLARAFPFESAAWDEWHKHAPANLSGRWLVQGHLPGRGAYWGTAQIESDAVGEYHAVYELDDATGAHFTGQSKAIVYTGYEWRGSGRLREQETREVFALSEDGRTLSGRWFPPDHSEFGGDWVATRAVGTTRIVTVNPVAARIGTTTRVTVFGEELRGAVSFGPGTKVKIVKNSPNSVAAEVTLSSSVRPGYIVLRVGKSSAADHFAAFDQVARLEVTPHSGIARVGGGKLEPVNAQYEAVAYADVPGASGSTTAISLGTLPVSWSVEPYNQDAREAQDVKFAGEIDQTGRFAPGPGGPNPDRKLNGNNTGDLAVVATLASDKATPIFGKAHLIVTVQRWNSPPIY